MEQQVPALFGVLHLTQISDATKDAAEETVSFKRLSPDDKAAVNYAARQHVGDQGDHTLSSLEETKNEIAQDPDRLESAIKQWQKYSSSYASRLQPKSAPGLLSR